NVFTDKDNDYSDIKINIIENTNANLVEATMTWNELLLHYQPNANGMAELTIRGTSNGLYADHTFAVIVAPVDDPPTLANAIYDVALDIHAESLIIDLTDVFADIDNSHITKTLLSNSNSDFVTVSIIENSMILYHQAGVEGETEITVQGLANGVAIEDSFHVYADLSDFGPQIEKSIEDMTVVENAARTTIDLSSIFTDPDTQDNSISQMIVHNSNDSLVTANISGHILTLDYHPGSSGDAQITVRATSRGKFVEETFAITVEAVDDPPAVAKTIPDITVHEDAPDMLIDLTPIFTDPDNADQNIVKSIVSNSNESLVLTKIIGNLLSLSYVPNASGSTTLILRGTSGEKSVKTLFRIEVIPVDDPPMIATKIQQIIVNEDAPEQILDLSGVFTDLDDYDTNIQLSLLNNSNRNLVDASISGQWIHLRYLPEQSGSAIISIRGTSNGLFAEDQLKITVNTVDDPPVVVNAIADVSMGIHDELLIIDLTNVFMDSDNNVIVKTIQKNTNSDLATALIIENSLIIEHQAFIEGETEITIQGISNGQIIEDTFKVFVNDTDIAPEVSTAIDDIIVPEDRENTVIDLTAVFTDQDNNNHRIEKIIVSNTNDSLVIPTIEGNDLILSYVPNAFGAAHITVRGSSQGKTVDDTFTVSVTQVDDPPVVANALNDLIVDEDASEQSIQLNDVFTDIDNDDTNIQTILTENSNTSLVEATLSDNVLKLNFLPNQNGTAEITIMATSNGLTVTDQLMITVNAVNDYPVMSTVLDQKTFESTAISQISMMIDDPDSRQLTITALSSDTQLLPLERVSFTCGQSKQNQQISVDSELFVNPIFLNIEPASGEAGEANISL
ncbi:peptidase-like protein, partial [Candidatus Magnetomorum sp. HK-1]